MKFGDISRIDKIVSQVLHWGRQYYEQMACSAEPGLVLVSWGLANITET